MTVGYESFPSIVDDRVVHDLKTRGDDGEWLPVLRLNGLYGDVRDNVVAARICALSALVVAGGRAATLIEELHAAQKATGSGNAVLLRLKLKTETALLRLTTARRDLPAASAETEAAIVDGLDGSARDLVDIVSEAVNQIQYTVEKFGVTDPAYDTKPLEAAVDLAEKPVFHFEGDGQARFDEWSTASAAALAAARAKFSR
jgi:hypothetical protein